MLDPATVTIRLAIDGYRSLPGAARGRPTPRGGG